MQNHKVKGQVRTNGRVRMLQTEQELQKIDAEGRVTTEKQIVGK